MRIFQEKKIVTLTLLCFLFSQAFWIGAFAEEPETSEEPELPPELSGEQQTASFDPAALELASQSAVPAPDTISLELKGVDVLDVLKILAARSGLNIVAGTNVRGPVTIYLKEVSVEQALDTIVSALGLAYEEDQQIIKVMTRLEYEALHGRMFRDPRVTRSYQLKWADLDSAQALVEQLKSPQGKIVADPRTKTMIVTDRPEINDEIANLIGGLDQAPITRSFRIQYARAEDLEKTLADYLTGGKGILKIDKRTNQVTVTDRQEVIDQIATVISSTDVRPAQVLIEAQVIEVALFDAFRWGIDWDYVRSKLIRDIDLVSLAPNFDVTAPTSALLGSGT
ncbi:MAG: hypothetical protein HY585_03590, partial [Candidatus Omnitrophica bacterium]|nr:hypothetical protein [Candidatus Omnitrophota bacterium]